MSLAFPSNRSIVMKLQFVRNICLRSSNSSQSVRSQHCDSAVPSFEIAFIFREAFRRVRRSAYRRAFRRYRGAVAEAIRRQASSQCFLRRRSCSSATCFRFCASVRRKISCEIVMRVPLSRSTFLRVT